MSESLKTQLDSLCGENEYTKRADEFLRLAGLEFRAVLVGDDCPPFCEDMRADRDMDKVDVFPRKTHIHGKHYRCTVSGKGRGHVSFDFWNSYADTEYNYLTVNLQNPNIPFSVFERAGLGKHYDRYVGPKPRTVQAYDLLACLQKSDVGTFENFCADFGYDTDSRRALETFEAVTKEWRKVQNFFTQDEIEALQEIN